MKSYNSFTYYGYWLPRIKFYVRFILRIQGQSDVGSIVASVTHAGKRFLYSLGYHRIPTWHWDKARQRMLPRTPRAKEINAEIDRLLEAIILFYSSARNVDAEEPTLDGLKAMLFPERVNASKRVDQASIVGLFQRFLKEHTNGGRPLSTLTLLNYKIALSSGQASERSSARCRLSSTLARTSTTHDVQVRRVVANDAGSPARESWQRQLLSLSLSPLMFQPSVSA